MAQGGRFLHVSTELIRELKRAQKWLPPYNENSISIVAEDLNASADFIRREQESAAQLSTEPKEEDLLMQRADDRANGRPLRVFPDEVSSSVYAHKASMDRHKRCVLAYLNYRMAALRELWWQSGSGILAEEFRSLLSPREIQSHAQYDALLSAYMAEADLSLTSDLSPPKDPMLQVRAIRDGGEVQTETGVVRLQTNTIHLMRRSDAELLIRQGILVLMEAQ